MNIWSILDIQATEDKDAIKKAYRKRLTGVNPEDNPEGFMELRRAYEEAIRLADEPKNTADTDDTAGHDGLIYVFNDIYNKFDRRISVKSWQELFDRDEFVALDTAEEAGSELLVFLMKHFYLPRRVWQCIVYGLDIRDRRSELIEKFPEDFIDYIINNSLYDDVLNYDLIEGDSDLFDSFIETYYRLDQSIRKRQYDEQKKYFDELDKMDVRHPYVMVSHVRSEIQQMNEELAQKENDGDSDYTAGLTYKQRIGELYGEMVDLWKKYTDDIFITNTCGDICLILDDIDGAKKYYDMTMELAPDNYVVRGKQAELFYCMGEYEKSRDMYMSLLRDNRFDGNARAGMIKANQSYAISLRERLKDTPDDVKTRLELAWCLYQSYSFSEAVELLSCFTPGYDESFEYYNVKGRSYLCLERYEDALECFERWYFLLKGLQNDAMTEEDVRRYKRYGYVNFLMGQCLMRLGRYDKSREFLDVSLGIDHAEILLTYEALCELEYLTENYPECISACERLLIKDNRNYMAYSYMSKAYGKLGYLKDAIVCCEHAIGIYPYPSEPYATEIGIYLKVNQPESAQNVIDRYRLLGIDSDRIDFMQACIYENDDRHEDIVKLLSVSVKQRSKENTDMDDYSELRMMLAFHMLKLGDAAGAKEQYRIIISEYPEHGDAYGMLARIERDEGNYSDAMRLFDRQLALNPTAFYYISRGILHRYLMNYKSAVDDFKSALVLEPDNSFCYIKLGQIYELHNKYSEALECYRNAIECGIEDEELYGTVMLSEARVHQCMCSFTDSRTIYEEYIDRFGINADMLYDYAELLYRMDKADEATRLICQGIDTLEYSDALQACLRLLCYIYGSEGYIDKANETLMLAVSKNENDAKAYATMGEIFFTHGLTDDARIMYEKAVLLDIDNNQNYYSELVEVLSARRGLFKPDIKECVKRALDVRGKITSPVMLINLARVNRVLKKYSTAMKLTDKAIGQRRCRGCFYGRCHEAYYERGLIYEAMHKYKNAMTWYREALKICGHNALYEKSIKRIENK